jgi:hypothetical protein
MSTTLGVSPSPSQSSHTLFSAIRLAVRNFFERLGFELAPASDASRSRKRIPHHSHSWGIFPALPRDYIRRRRVMLRISNIVIVILLSAAVAYAIVHVSGPAAFSAPHR